MRTSAEIGASPLATGSYRKFTCGGQQTPRVEGVWRQRDTRCLVRRLDCREESSMKTEEIVGANPVQKSGFTGTCCGSRWEFALRCFLASSALAQYGGGGTGRGRARVRPARRIRPPKNGYGSGKAIGSGLARQRLGLVCCSWPLHHRGGVTGCVQKTDDGLATGG